MIEPSPAVTTILKSLFPIFNSFIPNPPLNTLALESVAVALKSTLVTDEGTTVLYSLIVLSSAVKVGVKL